MSTPTMEVMLSEDSKELKRLAQAAVSRKDFTSGFIYLSQAIRLEPDNYELYLERNLCFMEEEQFHFALKDAEVLIRLRPGDPQGYKRVGEVYFTTQNYSQSLQAFLKSFQVSKTTAEKEKVMEWVKKARKEFSKQSMLDREYPFLGAAVGIVLAAIGITGDYLIRRHETFLAHPLMKVLAVILTALVGYGFAYLLRNHIKNSRAFLLEPPIDLLSEEEPNRKND
uniref:Heat shock protein sti1 homolog n=1 Tax=Caligus clemensi TaxID=344056 RepID=C1C2L0_CALCM|nr:Heat shock protein sti1 homolog [Caligus clemensi]